MLGRQVLGFLPSHIVPAAASFAGIYVFTRFASPEEYGLFALVMSVAQMCQSVLFYWIQVGATRHVDAAIRDGSIARLKSAVYRSHAATFLLFCIGYAIALMLLPMAPREREALWYALLIVGLRSLVMTNQGFNRGELRTGRYNLIECTQALVQLALGLALLLLTPYRAGALLASAVAASLMVALIDWRNVIGAMRRPAARADVGMLLRFGLPLSVSFALNYVLATSDRLLVNYYLGAGAVGVYSVAYGLMDRAVSSLFIAISLAAFPLAIRAFEREGAVGATRQLRENGRLLMAVAVPVCALLICLNEQLAEVMVGEAFRLQSQAIMPWVALAALMSGFQIHFFDHAFHLTRRTMLFLWTAGPAAVLNIVLNIVLLPRIGLMGAVWATLASYAVSLAASVLIGSRVLKVPLDLPEFGRVLLACAVMSGAVWSAHVPGNVLGLAAASLVALASYGAAAYVLDIAHLRTRVAALRAQWSTR